MSRLQKKCFIAATGMHLLLVVILMVGPAFLSRNQPDDSVVITFIDLSKLSDKPTSGGGSAPLPPPPTPPSAAPRQAEPTPPTPTPTRTVQQTPTVVPTRERVTLPTTQRTRETTEPVKPASNKPEISKKLVTRSSTDASSTANAQARDRADVRRRSAAVNDSIRNLRTGLSSATSIEPQLGAGDGEANMNYADAIRAIYEARWIQYDNVAADDTSAKATFIIANDGTVLSADITRSSGNTKVDAVLQKTIDSLRNVPPFPAGAKEAKRTFVINFNHKSKPFSE